MFEFDKIEYACKEDFYEDFMLYAKGLISDEIDLIANMANISSLCYFLFEDISWVGFYLYKEEQLVLGPFHGKPACVRIDIGKGVCGTAAETRKVQIVENVHEFPGHIPCDGGSNSEIVLPIIVNEQLLGVLDIDSYSLNRFDTIDHKYLQQLLDLIFKGA